MATKTITITRDAYETLRSMKGPNESFSRAILRIAKRKPLGYFYGALSKESGEKLEKAVMKMRRIRNEAHKRRIKKIVKELKK